MTISPRNPRSPEGKDSTSVTRSLPRNWRLSARIRRSEMIAMLRSPFAAAGATFAIQAPSPRVAGLTASGVATLTRSRAAAICVVCLDDRLHEFVADHVALVEVNERDAFDLADDFHRLHQTRYPRAGQIDLRDVARHHRLRTKAEARQEHLHLFSRRVLRFVQDHERIVQRAAA